MGTNISKFVNKLRIKEDELLHKEDLKVVLLGKTGVGKSASGNTILGKGFFEESLSSRSVTSMCQKESSKIGRRWITVIDTPGLFDTNTPNKEITKEIAKCITLAAPGPHVFLLVLTVGRFTQEEKEAVKMIQDLFGEESSRYTMVLFTRGDDLRKTNIEKFVSSDRRLQYIIDQCGNRYHVLNNRNPEEQMQVTALLEKIDSMVAENGGSFYTNEMFQDVENSLKEELRAKHEAEMEKLKTTLEKERQKQDEERKKSEKEFREREEQIKEECKLSPISSTLRVTVGADRLTALNRSAFSGHISLTTAVRHCFTNSPSVNGFPLLAISLAT
uniref:AIG1-type G domain-containing protein n=1 Tax=Astyanax mexicanus TaxID=7994 RepID=A0A3B1KHA7_ASTMX